MLRLERLRASFVFNVHRVTVEEFEKDGVLQPSLEVIYDDYLLAVVAVPPFPYWFPVNLTVFVFVSDGGGLNCS